MNYLANYGFRPGKIEDLEVDKIFQEILNHTRKYMAHQQKQSPNLSEKMAKYFEATLKNSPIEKLSMFGKETFPLARIELESERDEQEKYDALSKGDNYADSLRFSFRRSYSFIAI